MCVKWAGLEIDEGRPVELVACATDSYRMVIIGLGVDQARALEMLDDDKTDGVLIPVEVHGLKLGKTTRLRRQGVGTMINVNAGVLTVEMPPSTMRCKAMADVSQFPKVRSLFPKIPTPVAGAPGLYRDGATEALRPLVVPCGLHAGYVGSFDTVGQRMQLPYGTRPSVVRDMSHRPWRMVFAPDQAKPTVWSSSGEGSYTWQAWALLMPVRS